MELYVVTNNPTFVKEASMPSGAGMETADSLMDVLIRCQRLLDEGWRLAIDPLAGYRVRPNPFHTVFLMRDQAQLAPRNGRNYLWEIDSIAALMEKYRREQHEVAAHFADERKRMGHAAVDRSIALRSLDQLLAMM